MPDDQDQNSQQNPNAWAFAITVIKAVEDVLNDWRVMVTLLVVILLLAGRIAAPELGEMVEGWIHAWRGTTP